MSMPMRPTPDRPLTLREHFGSPAVWFAFLGGPLIWVAHFLAMYGFVSLACDSDVKALLYLPTIIAVPVAIAAGIVAWRLWRQTPEPQDPHSALDIRGRSRFIGGAGVLMSVAFLLAILFEGAAPLMLGPCGTGV